MPSQHRPRRILTLLAGITLCLSLLVAGAVVPAGAHETGRVGILIADHGEPVEFNERTYGSFRTFLEHLIELGTIPRAVLFAETGTILQDRHCYACPAPSPNPELVDGWGRPFTGEAAFVPADARTRTPAHYRSSTGPGVGEPDFYEHAGHSTRIEWAAMANHSPNYEQTLRQKEAVIRRLRDRYNRANPAIRVGYHINPHVDGSLSIAEAVRQLVQEDHVGHIVVAYHGVGFSDIMQTHMIRHEIHEELEALGSHVPLTHADPMWKSDWYIKSVVEKLRAELDKLPGRAKVAVHLSAHGLALTNCGTYDCRNDGYHEFASGLFAATKAAIEKEVRWSGQIGVFHLYGEGADPARDPDNLVDSPTEALAKRKAAGYQYVIDIPYGFRADSRDTLIVLRRSYGLTPPDWDAAYETRFVRDGLPVKITNSSFGVEHKIRAFEEVIRRALDPVLGVAGSH
ncbi:MAG: hypothetical protein AB1679_27255 [Actinomycetota bacterium]|jgi:protoheme ferro-lyase